MLCYISMQHNNVSLVFFSKSTKDCVWISHAFHKNALKRDTDTDMLQNLSVKATTFLSFFKQWLSVIIIFSIIVTL